MERDGIVQAPKAGQLLLMDQDTLNKKRASEEAMSAGSNTDSRDSKKKKAVVPENTSEAEAARQLRQEQ